MPPDPTTDAASKGLGHTTAPWPDPDAALMVNLRQGDPESFSRLLEKHRTPAIYFLQRMVQDLAVAEELSQELFLRVYKARETYEPTAKFSTWLLRLATNLAISSLRSSKSAPTNKSLEEVHDGWQVQMADAKPNVEERLLAAARVREIRLAIDSLPPKQRAAVIMHKYREMGYAEIAAEFRCSETAVKGLLFRAYTTLRKRLAHLSE